MCSDLVFGCKVQPILWLFWKELGKELQFSMFFYFFKEQFKKKLHIYIYMSGLPETTF